MLNHLYFNGGLVVAWQALAECAIAFKVPLAPHAAQKKVTPFGD